MGNVSTHLVDGVEKAIEARGARVFYLPATAQTSNAASAFMWHPGSRGNLQRGKQDFERYIINRLRPAWAVQCRHRSRSAFQIDFQGRAHIGPGLAFIAKVDLGIDIRCVEETRWRQSVSTG
jgi:hypothetical protein